MKNIFILFLLLLTTTSCNESSLISSSSKKADIKEALKAKMEIYGVDSPVFDIFNLELTQQQREALEFIYAYAPITDMNVDHDMLLDHVDATLLAREQMKWTDSISEELFLHFVLPIRVNNENLDSARVVFYGELKDRVKGMTLKDAALEVNHWCHEKAIYTPSDARTSSPLQSVKTAHGRCGEESVLAVAAMRSVGIPARQVYTPRWAHSDDNHAWVEIWGGDKWYYLGACEPETSLDRGWFTSSASRAMLMHTKVFGDYKGVEEVVSKNPSYTEINVTEKYAPVKRINVTVVDEAGKTVEGATVEFKIYNYAEFYTVATKVSDVDGKAAITLGLGDAIVWASKDGKFGFDKVDAKNSDSLTIELEYEVGDNIEREFDIVPPVESKGSAPEVTAEQVEQNKKRLKEEDVIRNKYVATFMTSDQISSLAEKQGVDKLEAHKYLTASRGNHKEIAAFLTNTPPDQKATALELLSVISSKDLRDISEETLTDHLKGAMVYVDEFERDVFKMYLLNPRVKHEEVTPYRLSFSEVVKDKKIEDIISIVKGVSIYDDHNIAVAPIKPVDALALKVADSGSRDILFVALARSAGVAARLEESTSKVQYNDGANWIDVNFGGVSSIAPKGSLKVKYKPTTAINSPKYSTHFTFSKIDDATTHRISMPRGSDQDMGVGRSTKELFAKPLFLDEGSYVTTSGTRTADGKVLARIESFDIHEDKSSDISLTLRENNEDLFVIGSINPEARVVLAESGKECSVLDITGRGYFIVALIKPNAEPTNHSLRALKSLTEQVGSWKRPVVVAVADTQEWESYNKNEFGTLPVDEYVLDKNGEIQKMFKGIKAEQLPIFVVADSFGRVVFKSQGYQINLGDNLSRVIKSLNTK